MTQITTAMVKELRERTGAGMMECKKALVEADGDLEAAAEILRKSGQAKAAKKAGRATGEGLVTSYIHTGGKIGVLLEVNCETDFVAKSPEFQEIADDTGKEITADALLTQRRFACYLVEDRQAHYHFTVKGNQPQLFEDIRLYFEDRGEPDFVMGPALEHGRIALRARRNARHQQETDRQEARDHTGTTHLEGALDFRGLMVTSTMLGYLH